MKNACLRTGIFHWKTRKQQERGRADSDTGSIAFAGGLGYDIHNHEENGDSTDAVMGIGNEKGTLEGDSVENSVWSQSAADICMA